MNRFTFVVLALLRSMSALALESNEDGLKQYFGKDLRKHSDSSHENSFGELKV